MQVAAKIAADLTPKTDSVDANIVAFVQAYDAVCEIILTSQGLTVAPNATPAPAMTDEQAIKTAFPEATVSSAPAVGFTVTVKGKQHGPIPEWLITECAKKGVTEVWDNRDGLAMNPRRPWFKSTTTNDAFWEPKRK
jgi:hypothetical protein